MTTSLQNNTDISIPAELKTLRKNFLYHMYLKEELEEMMRIGADDEENPYIEFMDAQISVDMREKFTWCANNKEGFFDDFFACLPHVSKHTKLKGISLSHIKKICLMPATSDETKEIIALVEIERNEWRESTSDGISEIDWWMK